MHNQSLADKVLQWALSLQKTESDISAGLGGWTKEPPVGCAYHKSVNRLNTGNRLNTCYIDKQEIPQVTVRKTLVMFLFVEF